MTRNESGAGRSVSLPRLRRVVSIGLCCGLVAGCSSVPDAVNPVEWYRGTRDWITGAKEPSEPRPATQTSENGAQAFPKLGSVPQRPAPVPVSESKSLARSLAADRASAHYTDEMIRRQVEANDSAMDARSGNPPSAGSPRPATTPPPQQASREVMPMPVPPPLTASQTSRALPSIPPPPPPPPSEPSPTASKSVQALREVPLRSPAAGASSPSPGSPANPAEPRVTSGQPIPPVASNRPQGPTLSAPAASRMPDGPLVFGPVPDDIVIDGSPPARSAPAPGAVRSQRRGATRTALIPAGRSPPGLPARAAGSQPPAVKNARLIASIGFASGSARLGAAGLSELRRAARAIRSRKLHVRVVGHASSRTKNLDPMRHQMANFQVSLDRANAVARELKRLGVSSSSITVDAVSDTQPAYYEVMPAGEAANRRVEILIEQ